MRKNFLNSPRLTELRKNKHKEIKTKAILICAGVIVILICLVLITRDRRVNINTVEVTGNKVIDASQVEEVIKEEISGNYLWVIPKSNFLFYPKDAVLSRLQSEFERFENISVKIKNPETLAVNLAEREPEFTWCGQIPVGEKETCYFMDEKGYIFDQAPYFSGNIYFKFYGDKDINIDDPKGAHFLPGKWDSLVAFIKTLRGIDMNPTELHLKEDEVTIKLIAAGNGNVPEVIFKLDDDYAKIIENLEAVMTSEPMLTKFKSNYGTLEYIDLRFGNKVYYKFK